MPIGRTSSSATGSSLRLAEGERVQEILLEARDGLLELDDRETAAEAETFLAHVFQQEGRHNLVEGHLAERHRARRRRASG